MATIDSLNALKSPALGIYVSIPFCRAKCSFCNFASGVSSAEAIEQYVANLCAEIDSAAAAAARLGADLNRTADSVYFGGGTPSLLLPKQLNAIFTALRENFDIDHNAEITMEAAPGQIADGLLAEALRMGVNRVSFGVQSFVDRESAAVGRTHTGEECLREFERMRAAGLRNIGADLIAGLPYQTEESWKHSLECVSGAGLTHVSVYMLEVDEDSRLGREVLAGGLRLHAPKVPDDEAVAILYEQACEELPRLGFAQYEISNFAKQGWQSRHNRKYWERLPYLGFGLDAHSMLRCRKGAVRFANADELAVYRKGKHDDNPTYISKREAFEECVFLGLRLVEGLDVETWQREFPKEWLNASEEAASELQSEGLMTMDKDRWYLTPRGRMLSNDVFAHLLTSVAA